MKIDHQQAINLVTGGFITSLDTHLARLDLACTLVDATLFQMSDKWRYDLHFMTYSGESLFIEINAKTSEIYSPEINLTGCISK